MFDRHIDAQELMPELRTLHPGEAEFAKRQAVYMIEQADDDKDGSLSLEEMLANPVCIILCSKISLPRVCMPRDYPRPWRFE